MTRIRIRFEQALCVALWVATAAMPASAQNARTRARGGVDGLEMALEGGLSAARGESLRWAITAYEVRGLSDLRPAVGTRVYVATSLQRTEDAAETTTDAAGQATVELAVPEDAPDQFAAVIRLVSAGGIQRRFELSVRATAPDRLSLFAARPQIEPGGTLRAVGRLMGGSDQRPRDGQTVQLTLRDGLSRPLAAPVDVQTDTSGMFMHAFSLPADVRGRLVITAQAGGDEHPIRANATSAVGEASGGSLLVAVAPERWVVEPRATVGVDVLVRTPNGRPVPGAEVTLPGAQREDSNRRATTDARGRARLRWHASGLANGVRDQTIAVQAAREGRGSAAGSARVRVAASRYAVGLSVEGGRLSPSLGGRLYVRVVDSSGHPAPAGVPVQASGPRFARPLSAQTTDGGIAVFDVRLSGRPDATQDRCGGETATALTVEVGASNPSRLSPCLALDPDAALRVRTAPRVARGGPVEVTVDRVSDAARMPVEVLVFAPRAGGQTVVGRHRLAANESRASIPTDGTTGVLRVVARALSASGEVVRGGVSAVWAAPGAAIAVDPELRPDGTVNVRYRGGAGDRTAYVVAAPLDQARQLATALRQSLAGSWPELPDEVGTSDTLLAAFLATTVTTDDAAPYVLRGRDVVPMPSPANPVAAGLLRDPWRARSRFVTGRLALIYRALEEYVKNALPERIDDVAVQTSRGFEFNAQVIESVAASGQLGSAGATGLAGETLTIEQLRAFDPSLSYDNVAARITRERLFRLVVALRERVHRSGWDLSWSRLGEPSSWMRSLTGQGYTGGRISQRDMVDGWGRPFELRQARGQSRFRFINPLGDWEFVSAGPDGRMGNGDDVWDPTARILRSGTPYAEAVGEDILVARLEGVELGRASIELIQNVEPQARVGGVRGPSQGPARVQARQLWASVPSVFEPPENPLALRRPARPGDGAGGARVRSGAEGGSTQLTLDEEPRTWGAVVFAAMDDGNAAVGEAQVLAGVPLIIESPLPSRLRAGESVELDLVVTNVSDRDETLSLAADGEGLSIQTPPELAIAGGTAERLTITLSPEASAGSGDASLRMQGSEGVTRTMRWPVERTTGDHPLRVRAAGLVHERPWRVRFRIPSDARRGVGRVVLLTPSGLAADPDLADLRESDPALVAFSNALSGRTSDPALWARLLRSQDPGGTVAGRDPMLSSAAAAVAWAGASEHDDDARGALARVRGAIGMPSSLPSPEQLPSSAAVLAALSSGGVSDGGRHRDPLTAVAASVRMSLRRALHAYPEEPSLLARAAGALLLADPRDTFGRAMLERAASHLTDTSDGGARVVPSDDRDDVIESLSATYALAVAAHQTGDSALAERLVRGALSRDHVALRAGGETAFWRIAAGAYGAMGTDAESVTVRIDGRSEEVSLTSGRGVLPLRPSAGEHEVVVEGGAGHALVRVEAAVERPFTAREDGPLSLRIDGEAGDAGSLAALELTVTANEAVARPVLDIALPAGVTASEGLRASMRSGDVISVEARAPGFVRVRLSAMANGTERRVSLPLRWTVYGTLRGLGVVGYPLSRPSAMTVLAPRTLDVARSLFGDAAVEAAGAVGAHGGTIEGELTANDERRADGKFVDRYPVQWTAGETLQILLDSEDFDTWLRVVSPSGNVYENDDRPGGGLNSGVSVPVNESGTWTIEVTSYSSGNTGRYVVRVQEE
ncbi:MAG: pre-peptidase C-terminal domain-containing protein [Sandaracinaceae bacterium]